MAEDTKQPEQDKAEKGAPAEQDNLPENKVDVEEVGTLKKKVTVTIPRERIDAKRDEMFGELADSAQVPGFRIGRAPRRLIEKRFGKEVAQDVRNALIGESIGDAIEKSELKTIGEPDLDLEKIELPDTGDMEFSFEAEVAPEFGLPELKDIKVEKPAIKITDERIDAQLEQWAASQATFQETDDPAAPEDSVTAGAKITIEGIEEPIESHGLTLRVAPGQIEGIPLLDLPNALKGKKAGESAALEATVNQAHPNEQWRGKKASIEIDISQVRKRILPEMDDEFAEAAGFDSLKELRGFVRSRAEAQLSADIDRAMHGQIEQYLLDKTEFDLPEGLTQRHTDRLVQRRFISLLQQGVPRERIDQQLTELQAAAGEQAKRDLKLRFILDKIAEDKEIEATADEVNARVAEIAGLYNRRPERLRQELAADGSLQQLGNSLREDKVIKALLGDAQVTEAKEEKPPEKATKKKSTKKAAKRSVKKTAKKAESSSGEKKAKKTTKK